MKTDRPTMLARAARMRREPTEPERRLWQHLRASQLGYKFRRQATLDGRIVDFFCPQKGLVLEIDGDTHRPELDAISDRELNATKGFSTLRFSNKDVMTNRDGVLTSLRTQLDVLPDRWQGSTTPSPSSEEEGRGAK